MFSLSNSSFDKLLDKATSNLLLEPDWNAIMQICDSIRGGDIKPKYALNGIVKKLFASNPHVNLFALQVLESCVKNCGQPFHAEVATKSFMEEIRELVKVNTNEKVREKILELIQTWAHAFRNEPSYRAIQDTVNLMKIEGFKFPVLKESDAMFIADSAPQWEDGDNCNRCRVAFSVVQRKHHCRNCGQIFCAKCSSKQSIIPKYGIEKEVRVCEDCYDKLNKPSSTAPKSSASNSENSSPFKDTSGVKASAPPSKSEQELIEEEELQMAIALSKSEAESKEKERLRSYSMPTSSAFNSEPKSEHNYSTNNRSFNLDSKTDSELSRYLNRDYWEQKVSQNEERSKSPLPSAPKQQSALKSSETKILVKTEEKLQNGENDDLNTFLSTLRSAIEIFVNRMNSNQVRGRPIANDSAVQSLFLNITNMHSQLLKHIQETDDARVYYESLQDKLSQIRDARAALDSLREEHQEKLRREAEESERIRQQQMAQKLEIMRKKKQEYLQYQRQMALQRIHEQERELQLRQEQQKYMWQQQQQQPNNNMYSQAGTPYPQPAASVYGAVAPPPVNQSAPLPQGPSLPQGHSPIHMQQYPQQVRQPTPVYSDYSGAYNIQNVASALPVSDQSFGQQPMQTQMPNMRPVSGMESEKGHLPPQQVYQQPMPPQQPMPTQQPGPPQQPRNEPVVNNEQPLISFD
ncbi:Hepatocyte growth factor-regulated tyrosine kinase substrate-like protein [Dinothrombium tinctorium]|uniref:Hepatocyte growth factor-regulated tyrosine kinase substrate n=1 Tax=Dinothrombium tinctorium TaxID=1965070 RepID=A0A443R8T5_9ACAR|nr:Hepatocyte growth factor-regulated tyrosine kinase substrate-like protein [Dinothrombium tinctorium]